MSQPRAVPPPQQRPSAAGPPLGTWLLSHPGELAGLRSDVSARTGSSGDAAGQGGRLLLLVVSELATNGLKYGTPPLTVSVHRTSEGWLVDVRDGRGDRTPTVRPLAPARPGGHGMRIVDRLSLSWGWYRDDAGSGKHVWAHISHSPLT